jgi:hypothetical protein
MSVEHALNTGDAPRVRNIMISLYYRHGWFEQSQVEVYVSYDFKHIHLIDVLKQVGVAVTLLDRL